MLRLLWKVWCIFAIIFSIYFGIQIVRDPRLALNIRIAGVILFAISSLSYLMFLLVPDLDKKHRSKT